MGETGAGAGGGSKDTVPVLKTIASAFADSTHEIVQRMSKFMKKEHVTYRFTIATSFDKSFPP